MSILRKAGQVRRFHTVPTIGSQTVAEHSFNVCLILLSLTKGQVSTELLKAALYHDLPEIVTGDVPATVKWQNHAMVEAMRHVEERFELNNNLGVELSDTEKLLLKFADMLELVHYCLDQLKLGNRNMYIVAERGVSFLHQLLNNQFGEYYEVCRYEMNKSLGELRSYDH